MLVTIATTLSVKIPFYIWAKFLFSSVVVSRSRWLNLHLPASCSRKADEFGLGTSFTFFFFHVYALISLLQHPEYKARSCCLSCIHLCYHILSCKGVAEQEPQLVSLEHLECKKVQRTSPWTSALRLYESFLATGWSITISVRGIGELLRMRPFGWDVSGGWMVFA